MVKKSETQNLFYETAINQQKHSMDKTYLVTAVLTIISFSFVMSEWRVIFETGKQMFDVALPIAEKMMMQI